MKRPGLLLLLLPLAALFAWLLSSRPAAEAPPRPPAVSPVPAERSAGAPAAAEGERAGTAMVEGRVVDARTGAAVSGVRFRIARHGGEGRAEATTDGDGAFRLADLAPGQVCFVPVGPDWMPADLDLYGHLRPRVLGPGETTGVEVRVVRAGAIAGRVLDVEGRPLAGAEVRVRYRFGRLVRYLMPLGALSRATVRTGPDGRFRLGGLLAGESFVPEARHPRAGPAVAGPVVATSVHPPEVVFRLGPARAVPVEVRDATTNEPVAGATVRGSFRLSVGESVRWSETTAVTGEKGRAVLAPVPSGEVRVTVRATGYAGPADPLPIPEGEIARPIAIRLERAGTELAEAGDRQTPFLRLLDPAGRPVAAAGLALWPLDLTVPQFVAAVGEGGECRLVAEPLDPPRGVEVFGARAVDGSRLGGTFLDFPPERDRPLEVRLPPGGVVAGRVVDAGGTPVGGLRLTAERRCPERGEWESEDSRPVHGEAITDGAGGFRLPGIGDGTYDLLVPDPGPFAVPPPVAVRAGDRDVVLRLEEGFDVVWRFLDPNGDPVPGVAISWFPPRPESTGRWDWRGAPTRLARSDGDGRARFSGRAPGDSGSTFLDLPDHRPDLRLPDGGPERHMDRRPAGVIYRLEWAATISGRVVDGAEDPVDGAEVTLRSPGRDRTDRTGEDGRFSFKRVPLGEHRLSVSGGAPVPVLAGDAEVVLRRD